MDSDQLEAARMLFEDHLINPLLPNNVFFARLYRFGESLENLAFEMLQKPQLVNDWLNWEHCREALYSVGVDISHDSFFSFSCYEEAVEEMGEDGIEEMRPEDVKHLLEYFSAPRTGLCKLEEWL